MRSTELYIPAYVSYVQNCVHSHPGLNGTILFGVVYDAAFLFAAVDGNSLLLRGIEKYNIQATADCELHSRTSSDILSASIATVQQANLTLNVSKLDT
jgi:hypothetical protein